MKCLPALLGLMLAACSTTNAGEPSLAPRTAEAVDPRLPVANTADPAPVDPALAARLSDLVAIVEAGAGPFEQQRAEAERLAASAGPMASESWVAAQQSLSRLVELYGVTTRASAEIDALAGERLGGQRWIRPADQQAIGSAQAQVMRISTAQAEAIGRLTDRLAR